MTKNSPWIFIPSLYLAEGFPYVIINTVSAILFADLGFSNEKIAFWTGWLYLPWILKMFWSPFVDGNLTKRKWLIAAQMILSFIFLFVSALCFFNALCEIKLNNPFFFLSLTGFSVGAFASATLDIATDGYYMLALSPKQQSSFVGIRTIFYRAAMILGSGIFVSAVGFLANKETSNTLFVWPYNWAAFFAFLALLFGGLALWHQKMLPFPKQDAPLVLARTNAWKDSFFSYFNQKNIAYILLFILLYRLGDAFLEKIVPLFLVKPAEEGAMGISLQALGFIKGTLGLGAVIAGNLLGGWLLGRFGFKKCIWPFAVILILPNFFYAYMAWAKPSLLITGTLITLEHFGNGLAMMAFSVFIMYISLGKYKTSHYAISTGIMALGMMLPSMLSGWMQSKLGYTGFFLAAGVISLAVLFVIPLTKKIQSLEETEKLFKENKPVLTDVD